MSFLALLMTNLGLAGAVAVAVWVTKSPWPLLAFCFTMTYKSGSKKCDVCEVVLACPKCGKQS